MHPTRLRAEKPLVAGAAHGAPFFQNSKAESAARAPAPRPESRQPPQAEPGRFEDASAGSHEGNRPGFLPESLDSLSSTPPQVLRHQAQIPIAVAPSILINPTEVSPQFQLYPRFSCTYFNDDAFETISSKQAKPEPQLSLCS